MACRSVLIIVATLSFVSPGIAQHTPPPTTQSGPQIAGAPAGPVGTHNLWYDAPAENSPAGWVSALPIGNGALGAMIFGQPVHERLQLNQITLWSGKPEPDADRPDAHEHLAEIRAAIAKGDYRTAQALTTAWMTNRGGGFDKAYSGSYQTLGDLLLEMQLPDGPITQYRRWLDIEHAVAHVEYVAGGTTFHRELLASATAGVIAIRLSSTAKNAVSFTLQLRRGTTTARGADPNRLLMTGNTDMPGHPGNCDFESQAQVLISGGNIDNNGDRLTIARADQAIIYLAADTSYALDASKNFHGEAPHGKVERAMRSAASVSYSKLMEASAADYARLFGRVRFDLPATAAATRPTDQRITAYGAGLSDPSLASLYYQFGRYLMIASSRADSPLPANLQGLWGDGLHMPWQADYHTNINLEMNYWPAQASNLGECDLPMARLVESLVEPGRKTARAYFDAPGWMVGPITNAWGWTSPGWESGWGTWYGADGWLCQQLWEHYAYTRDREFLRRVYPVMKEACIFYMHLMTPNNEGFLVTSPSASPENKFMTPWGATGNVSAGAAMDREIIWDLYGHTISASNVLKVDADFRNELSAARDKILPPKIGASGQLQEWADDWDLNDPEPHHRHVSHLFAVFPGSQISLAQTPEWAAAARGSLLLRGDGGTGWSKAWKVALWARLHEGDHAFALLRQELSAPVSATAIESGDRAGGTYPNLFNAGPPFQIDGNFGCVAGINEMLLQSQETYVDAADFNHEHYVLELLPALPHAWADGSIKGLRARGGFSVDLEWKAGKLTQATIRAAGGTRGMVRVGNKTTAFDLTRTPEFRVTGN